MAIDFYPRSGFPYQEPLKSDSLFTVHMQYVIEFL